MSFNFDPCRLLFFARNSLLLVGLLSLIALLVPLFFVKSQTLSRPVVTSVVSLPRAFRQPLEFYSLIGSGPLELKYNTRSSPLISLKHELSYYGLNERPDSKASSSTVLFASKGSDEIFVVPVNTTVYLIKNDKEGLSKFQISTSPQASDLWLKIIPQSNEALFQIGLQENSEKFSSSVEFILARETRQVGTKGWESDGLKLDAGVLSRQKARWVKKDVFIDLHGGKTFAHLKDKSRIDFEDKGQFYSCFVQEGDCLVWNEGWKVTLPAESTQQLTMMQVKKIDDRIMQLTLWSPNGKQSIPLSIIRSADPPDMSKTVQAFKYLGSKSWNEWVFELNGKRQTIKPKDWFLKTEKGWKKLTTKKELEAYANFSSRGELLVIEKVVANNQQKSLRAHLFNSLRTQVHQIEIPMKPTQIKNQSAPVEKELTSPTTPHTQTKEIEPPKNTTKEASSPPTEETTSPNTHKKVLKKPNVLRGRPK